MKILVRLRQEYPKNRDLQAKKQIAKEEFDAWNGYLDSRREDSPKPDFEID